MDSVDNTDSISLGDIFRSSASRRIRLLKVCDWVLGPLALALTCRKKSDNALILPSEPQNILVIRPGGIGDAVLLLPFIKKLKEVFCNSRIDILAEKRNIRIFDSLGEIINKSYCYEEGFFALRRRFKSASYRMVFDMEQWHFFSAVFAAAAGAPVRVGFDTNKKRSGCYNCLVPYSHDDFEGAGFLNMLSKVVADSVMAVWDGPFLDVPKPALEWASEKLSGRNAIAISLKGGIKERCYPIKSWHLLCQKLLEDGFDICLIGGREDEAVSKTFSDELASEKVINLIGQASLLQSAAAISRCKVFVGTDSGAMHLAFGAGTPIVALLAQA